MHLPHKMHFSGSRTTALVESSIGRSRFIFGKYSSEIPKSATIFWSSQLLLRPQMRQSLGWFESISSRTLLLIATISGSWVVISIPSSIGVQQALSILLEPFALTTQMPQDADGGRSGCLQSVGIFIWTLLAASSIVVPSGTLMNMSFIFACMDFAIFIPLIPL